MNAIEKKVRSLASLRMPCVFNDLQAPRKSELQMIAGVIIFPVRIQG